MSNDIKQYQICVYTPDYAIENVLAAMHEAGAGIISNYSHCATYFDTLGQFKPLENSNPHIGQKDVLEKVKERKLEVICEDIHIHNTIIAMVNAHPYETPVYTIIELNQKSPNYGLGYHGIIEQKATLKDFAMLVKENLKAPYVRLWTADRDENTFIRNIAVCGGSGNSVIHEAKQVADVLVSSDFTYHQLLDAPIPIIDAGHYFTENPIINTLKDLFIDLNCDIITASDSEHDISRLKIFV
jgi:hypothetical protein